MPALLRHPGSAGTRPCQGCSYLDRACAPAEYGSYREARTGKISQFEVSTLSGEPRKTSNHHVRHSLSANLDPIEAVRNCIMHNRTVSDTQLQNYRRSYDELMNRISFSHRN